VSHQEFPGLTPEAKAAFNAGCSAAHFPAGPIGLHDRRYLAAFLREAIEQATENYCIVNCTKLRAIADNLHSPPPPPPTLAEARAADLDSPAGKAVVRGFLASLSEGTQSCRIAPGDPPSASPS
jgi:hypothetical protein